jgi:hypothetical protein
VGLAGGDVLVKFSYDGDANGDGLIDADDYFRIDSGFLSPPPDILYFHGDFNYDRIIDADDYFLIDSSFLGQGTPLSSAHATRNSTAFSTTRVIADPIRSSTQRKRRKPAVASLFDRVAREARIANARR